MNDMDEGPLPLTYQPDHSAEIERIGRWTYRITYHDGLMMEMYGQRVWGRERAERKARQGLEKRRNPDEPEKWIIR